MDIADEAQRRSAHFHELAMQNRAFDLPPAPALNTAPDGSPLCVDCDADITERRRIIASAQRCPECQQDHEKRTRNHG